MFQHQIIQHYLTHFLHLNQLKLLSNITAFPRDAQFCTSPVSHRPMHRRSLVEDHGAAAWLWRPGSSRSAPSAKAVPRGLCIHEHIAPPGTSSPHKGCRPQLSDPSFVYRCPLQSSCSGNFDRCRGGVYHNGSPSGEYPPPTWQPLWLFPPKSTF